MNNWPEMVARELKNSTSARLDAGLLLVPWTIVSTDVPSLKQEHASLKCRADLCVAPESKDTLSNLVICSSERFFERQAILRSQTIYLFSSNDAPTST